MVHQILFLALLKSKKSAQKLGSMLNMHITEKKSMCPMRLELLTSCFESEHSATALWLAREIGEKNLRL